MPDSKLVEKLGFRVTENGDVVNLAATFLHSPLMRELGSEKYAMKRLWNLCLELSAALTKLGEHVDPFVMKAEYEALMRRLAEKEKKA